jgi:hypothetical protein
MKIKKLLTVLVAAALAASAQAGQHMRSDLMGGWEIEDDSGRIIGHLRSDLMGGWIVEDQNGTEIGHWRSDLMGGFEYQPEN